MEILSKILGNPARVKIMRLFLLNKEAVFTNKEVIKRSRVNPDAARKELNLLFSTGFIKKRSNGYFFDSSFKYIVEFENLLVNSDTLDKNSLNDIFKKVGKIKLLIVSGIFIKNKDSRVDLLVVGDKLKRGKIEEEIRKLEAEIGIEIIYAIFDTKEFLYRLNMHDKLVWDIIDFEHEVILMTKELSTEALKKV